jgi:hypothetical protein
MYVSIEEIIIIGECGKNFAHKIADFIISEHPDIAFKGKRLPTNYLINHLGITMEQALKKLLEHENKSHSL